MKKFIKNGLKYVLLFILVIAVLVFVFKFKRLFHDMSYRHLKRFLLSYGKFSALAFIIIYSLKAVLLVIPASLLSIVAGNIYGPLNAFIFSIIGCFFSGTLAFCLAKALGKPFVDKLLKGKVLKLDSAIEKHGFIIMLLMRLSFVFPYDVLSYAAGLTKIKYRDYILGTILGIIPEMILYSYIGKNFGLKTVHKLIIPIILMILLALAANGIYRKYLNSKNNRK